MLKAKCKQLGTIENVGDLGSNESTMKIELNEEDMDLKGRGVEKNKQKIKKVRSEKEF